MVLPDAVWRQPAPDDMNPIHYMDALHLLAEEAHPDVVPELRGVGCQDGCHPVLNERYIHIGVILLMWEEGRYRRKSGGDDGLGYLISAISISA